MERFAAILTRYHRWLLAVAVLLGLASLPLSQQLELDWRVETMFAEDDPLAVSYRRLQERFAGNDICLAVYRDPHLWVRSGDGLDRLQETSRRLADVDGVEAVLSLSELHQVLKKLRGPWHLFAQDEAPVSPLLDEEDQLAQRLARVFEGYTHRRNGEYVAVACLLATSHGDTAERRGPAKYESTLRQMRAIMEDLPTPATEGLVTGEPVLVSEGFKLVERDGWRLGWISSLLVSLVLLICFRSVRWTLIPLCIVHWSLAMTRALLVALQLELTLVSSTLTAVVTVIGVATSMHLLLRYQQHRRHGKSRPEALTLTLAALLPAILLACLTDAIGFSALLVADVGPVRDFGLMMAVGSMMVFLAILSVVPGLTLIGRIDADPSTPRLDVLVRLRLRELMQVCLRRRWTGLAVLMLLMGLGAWGASRMDIETDFTKNFSEASPVLKGYGIIERQLGGAGVWDIMLPAPKTIDANYLQQVLELEEELRKIDVGLGEKSFRLTKVLSVADADQAARGGTLLSALPVAARLQAMRAAMPEFTSALLTDRVDEFGSRWLRIMLRSREQVPASAKRQLIGEVERVLADYTALGRWRSQFDGNPPPAEVAGYHVMLSGLVASVLDDQWKCFWLAAGGIWVILILATRSIGLASAAMLPNALPILLVLGTLGWLGIRANMGTALIAAVSIGLTVDSSIHYLLHYRRRMQSGDSAWRALRSAQENVGLAALLATFSLVAGFVSLCTSEFVPTVVFGALASLTMLGGLLGNLVLLPLLLAPRGSKTFT